MKHHTLCHRLDFFIGACTYCTVKTERSSQHFASALLWEREKWVGGCGTWCIDCEALGPHHIFMNAAEYIIKCARSLASYCFASSLFGCIAEYALIPQPGALEMCCFQISRPAQPVYSVRAFINETLFDLLQRWSRPIPHTQPRPKLNWSHGWPPRIDSSRLIGRLIAQFIKRLGLLQRVVLVHYTLSGQYFCHKANTSQTGGVFKSPFVL